LLAKRATRQQVSETDASAFLQPVWYRRADCWDREAFPVIQARQAKRQICQAPCPAYVPGVWIYLDFLIESGPVVLLIDLLADFLADLLICFVELMGCSYPY